MRKVDKQKFAARFRSRRKKLGISQPKLAESIGTKQQTIANIESAKVERPRIIDELAEALQTTSKWLLWNEGPEEVRPFNPQEQLSDLMRQIDPMHIGVVIRYLKTLKDKDEAAA